MPPNKLRMSFRGATCPRGATGPATLAWREEVAKRLPSLHRMNEWWSKKFLQFRWNLTHLKFTINKCAEFSSFAETSSLWVFTRLNSLEVFPEILEIRDIYEGRLAREGRNRSEWSEVKWSEWSEWSEEFFSPRFRWNLAHLKFTIYKCAQFSSFGEPTFLWE